MSRALDLATSALGRVAPNPAVGAVIVQDGIIVGEGATCPPPDRHAEAVALTQAGDAARGSTIYVTLEPCSHQGRTPPCADAIIEAGIQRVVVACEDPNPLVNSQGVARLRAAGLQVDVGCRELDAREQLGGFFKRITTGTPRVITKYAMTIDGKIATRTRHSRWVSGPASRQHSHVTRDRVDAILIGAGTMVDDNPSLTTRLPEELCGYGGPHHPLRVVLDSKLRTPATAGMLSPEQPGSTLIYATHLAPELHREQLESAGAEIVLAPDCDGQVDIVFVLEDLGQRGINDLLVEGGGTVHGSFFDRGLVDQVEIYIAPVIVGGVDAPGPVNGVGVATMPEAWQLVDPRLSQLGSNFLLQARVARGEEAASV